MPINPLNNTTAKHNQSVDSQFTADKWANEKISQKTKNAQKTNPMAALDSDAFMQLLLAELKYQDPTSPMDSEKMLQQTSQLSTLETQQSTNKLMQNLADQMKNSFSMNAMSSLGKIAHVDNAIVKNGDNQKMLFSLNFDVPAKNGKIEIYNANGQVVRSIPFDSANAGIKDFSWNGTDDDGNMLPDGAYAAKAVYKDSQDKIHISRTGEYPVEAVKFKDGKALVKIAGHFVDIEQIHEFIEPQKG